MKGMVSLTRESLDTAVGLLQQFEPEKMELMNENEEKIDAYEDHIGAFLQKLSAANKLVEEDMRINSKILHGINEFERIADHALNLAKAAEELADKEISFSPQAQEEEKRLMSAIQEIYTMAIDSYLKNDAALAKKVEPLQGVIDVICATLKETHVERLQKGICTADQGFIFNDILTNCERISDHSMNVAVAVIRVSPENKDAHAYMHDLKMRKSPEYEKAYRAYYEQYIGPEETA